MDPFDPDNVTKDANATAVYEYRFRVIPNSGITNGDVRVTYNSIEYVVAPGATKVITAVAGQDKIGRAHV